MNYGDNSELFFHRCYCLFFHRCLLLVNCVFGKVCSAVLLVFCISFLGKQLCKKLEKGVTSWWE